MFNNNTTKGMNGLQQSDKKIAIIFKITTI